MKDGALEVGIRLAPWNEFETILMASSSFHGFTKVAMRLATFSTNLRGRSSRLVKSTGRLVDEGREADLIKKEKM